MNNLEKLDNACRTLGCAVKYDEPMRKHTTFRIGGNCAAFVDISTIESLQQILRVCQDTPIPYTVIGNGSNVLVSDQGYNGVVLHLGPAFSKIKREGNSLICESGAVLSKISKFALEESLSGMEPLTGIPGTAGGALYMNAGAYGSEMSHLVTSAKYMTSDGEIHTMPVSEMDLDYRHSIFQKKDWIIVEVALQLKPGVYGEIKNNMDTFMRKRRANQPLELPSAGSTFQRPKGSYASMLVDQCGLKGASVGDAQVSTKHAGFIVNTGKATCHDVLELCNFVQETVLEQTGYRLELEVEVLGE